MTDGDLVRSATRVLQLLEALNHHERANLPALQASTGLPKPTLVRLLNTLIHAGYVRRLSRTEGYTLTERVLRLADGFRHADQVVAVARGYLDAFTAEHKWPATLQTHARGAMVSRYSTRDRSPLNTDPSLINRRFPMLTTAHGRVYLAFCPTVEREMILAMLKASKKPANELAHKPKTVGGILREVREQGYCLRSRTSAERVIGFAVPVLHEGGIAATLGMRYFKSVMRPVEAVERYLAPLHQLATAVSNAMTRAEGATVANSPDVLTTMP